jgi:alkanesulfonate monooxygenase SsuD/methylene tetrahydromethanopterin reductase-like flavin-dependent oxidoreductase (luciferase family)
LSGELADGTPLGWFSSPGYVSWARKRIDEGRTRADRQDSHELVALCLLSISEDDPAAARRDLSRRIGPMLAGMAGSPQLKASITGIEPSALIEREEQGASAEDLPDALLGEFVASGDMASCAATVDRLLEAGADRVVLVPNPAGYRSTPAMVEQMRTASALARDARARR